MKEHRLTKKKLRELARISTEKMINSQPDPAECNHEFSPKFEEKMHALIYGAEIIPMKHRRRIPRAAIAVIALICLLGLGVGTPAFAKVIAWFSHPRAEDPKTIVYEYGEDHTGEKLPQIVIGWLPADFEGVEPENMSDDSWFSQFYKLNDERMIDFTISYMNYGSKLYITPEEGEILQFEEMTVNGNKAHLYIDSLSTSLVILDETHEIEIEIYSTFSKDEIIKVAESIQFVFDI